MVRTVMFVGWVVGASSHLMCCDGVAAGLSIDTETRRKEN